MFGEGEHRLRKRLKPELFSSPGEQEETGLRLLSINWGKQLGKRTIYNLKLINLQE